MKDIPVEELAEISGEIYEAALRLGCTDVSITGKIWPGAKASGSPEAAARFVEFSWHRAAVINGEAFFEEADPRRFLDLLIAYGLEDNPTAQPLRVTGAAGEESHNEAPLPPVTTTTLTAEVSPSTKESLERRAAAAGVSVGAFLDRVFGDMP